MSVRTVLTDQRGFTMTEMLMVTTVLAVILGGVILVQQQGQQAYLFGSHRIEVQQNGRAALELMSRELRSARSVTAVTGTTDLTFVDGSGTTVRYQLAGTTLNFVTGMMGHGFKFENPNVKGSCGCGESVQF